jgi:hypothetical protein
MSPCRVFRARADAAARIDSDKYRVAGRERVERRALDHDFARDSGEHERAAAGRGDRLRRRFVGERAREHARHRFDIRQRTEHTREVVTAGRNARCDDGQPVQRGELRERAGMRIERFASTVIFHDLGLEVEKHDGRRRGGRDDRLSVLHVIP